MPAYQFGISEKSLDLYSVSVRQFIHIILKILKIIVDIFIILCYNIFEVKGRHKVLGRNKKALDKNV